MQLSEASNTGPGRTLQCMQPPKTPPPPPYPALPAWATLTCRHAAHKAVHEVHGVQAARQGVYHSGKQRIVRQQRQHRCVEHGTLRQMRHLLGTAKGGGELFPCRSNVQIKCSKPATPGSTARPRRWPSPTRRTCKVLTLGYNTKTATEISSTHKVHCLPPQGGLFEVVVQVFR
jgi:hypothetical protein